MKLILLFLVLLYGCNNLEQTIPRRQNPDTFIGRWVFYEHDTIESLIWDIKTKDSMIITFFAEKNGISIVERKVPSIYWVEETAHYQFILLQYSDTNDILKFRVDSISQNTLYLNHISSLYKDHNVWKEWPVEPPNNVNLYFKRSQTPNPG